MTVGCSIALVWRDAPDQVSFRVTGGRLADGPVQNLPGRCLRQEFTVQDAQLGLGANATRIEVSAGAVRFAFFLRDVCAATPMLIAVYGVAVLPAADARTYAGVVAEVADRGLLTVGQRIESEPDETFPAACAATRDMRCPIWLGVSRDVRIFSVHFDENPGYWGYIEPRWHSRWPGYPDARLRYSFVLGKGAACAVDIRRWIEDDRLPILHSVQRDGEVEYHLTGFATLETGPLCETALRGTHWLAAYAHTGGNMLTDAEKQHYEGDLKAAEIDTPPGQIVCWLRIEACNTASVPRYAWFRGWQIRPARKGQEPAYDAATGQVRDPLTGRCYAMQLVGGQPMPQEEMAVLLQPGQTVTLDLITPNQPIEAERAAAFVRQPFADHYAAVQSFWRARLTSAAQVRVPEPAIDQRVAAGLLHCDLVALGLREEGPLLATIGWYAPIGSESSPIIQFFDSIGWHDRARRSLEFFLERQREDGFIQTFGGYELETGPVLWSMGEHFRYTRDVEWVRRHRAKIVKACDFLIAWRQRNRKPELEGRGYGMLDGKVADPNDKTRSFMLNALSHVGLKRAAEMLAAVDPDAARRIGAEAAGLREDIRRGFIDTASRSPVVPLGDGTWVPSFAPWPEYPGPLSLYVEGGKWFTHGAFISRDSIIGPIYLTLGEVFDADELPMTLLLTAHQELMTHRNAALTQPYYCRHDLMHLQRGEVRQFLKTYYNQMAALQDRQTYTFWEHYYHASEHKTHEEGWFLMQTRWMLWRERSLQALELFGGIPRAWLYPGAVIALDRVASWFGPLSVRLDVDTSGNTVTVNIRALSTRRPEQVTIRVPHPQGKPARHVTGGTYDVSRERVTINAFTGTATVHLTF